MTFEKTTDHNRERYVEKLEAAIGGLRKQIEILTEELVREHRKTEYWKERTFAAKDESVNLAQKLTVSERRRHELSLVSEGRRQMLKHLSDARNEATRKYHEAFERALNRQRDVEFLIRRFKPVAESMV